MTKLRHKGRGTEREDRIFFDYFFLFFFENKGFELLKVGGRGRGCSKISFCAHRVPCTRSAFFWVVLLFDGCLWDKYHRPLLHNPSCPILSLSSTTILSLLILNFLDSFSKKHRFCVHVNILSFIDIYIYIYILILIISWSPRIILWNSTPRLLNRTNSPLEWLSMPHFWREISLSKKEIETNKMKWPFLIYFHY